MHLHYEVAGAGPPVVFVHAGIADSRMWDAQFASFADDFRVVRYDIAGFGRSPLNGGPFSHWRDSSRSSTSSGSSKPPSSGAPSAAGSRST